MKIIEVCSICTNYGVAVYYTYVIAHSDDQNEVNQDLRRSQHHDYGIVYPARLLQAYQLFKLRRRSSNQIVENIRDP